MSLTKIFDALGRIEREDKLMTGTFLRNVELDPEGRHLGWFRGYEDGDKLEKVTTIELADGHGERGVETMFAKFNRGSGYDDVAFSGGSMSVGDVVVLTLNGEHTAYGCASFGFDKLTWEPRFTEFLNEFAVR